MRLHHLFESVEAVPKAILMRGLNRSDLNNVAKYEFCFSVDKHANIIPTDDEDTIGEELDVYYVPARKKPRVSQAETALAQQFLSVLPGWKKVPKRKYSTFATTDYKHLSNFGSVKAVILPEKFCRAAYIRGDWNVSTIKNGVIDTREINGLFEELREYDDISTMIARTTPQDKELAKLFEKLNKRTPSLNIIIELARKRGQVYPEELTSKVAKDVLAAVKVFCKFYYFFEEHLPDTADDRLNKFNALVTMFFGPGSDKDSNKRVFVSRLKAISSGVASYFKDFPPEDIEDAFNDISNFGITLCDIYDVPSDQEEVWFEGGYYMIVCDNPFFLARLAREGKMKNVLDYARSKIK